jgi:hypothetical protein
MNGGNINTDIGKMDMTRKKKEKRTDEPHGYDEELPMLHY